MTAPAPRWFPWLAAAVLSLGFLWFVAPGLSAQFTPDDVMNLNLAWHPPWSELLTQIALPWRPGLRPLGGALYRASFDAFGFDLTAVRILLIALLAFNTGLTAILASRLSGSPWSGWFAASFALYHVNFQALYWNTGACYDILAFSGTWSAALVALRARSPPTPPLLWLAALALFWLALGAKEIALALPAVLLAFELLPGRRQWAPLLCVSALSAAYLFGRIFGGGGILATAEYHPQITPAAYARSLSVMLGDLLYLSGLVPPAEAVLLLLAFAATAAAMKSRSAWVALACFAAGALPVALIPPRGVYAWYVPLAALWMLLGAALARLSWNKPVLWLAVTSGLFLAHSRAAHRIPRFILDEQEAIARVIRALPASDLRAAPGEAFLLTEDPFRDQPWGRWKCGMLIQLHTRRRDLHVYYPDQPNQPPGLIPIAWRGGRILRLTSN
jgi:hypothetical protein